MTRYWMLPDDVIELLPEESRTFEALRRVVYDTIASWGYAFVTPPLVEFLDSLLAGSDSSLDGQTFKVTDRGSGRLMGIRADITPQITRIDAHRLPTNGESRYGYIGEVLRTRSESIEPRRNTWIAGAELYGVEGAGGDIEVMALLLSLLHEVGVQKPLLDIGHTGIYAGLVQLYALSQENQMMLHDILRGNRRPDLSQWQKESALDERFVADVHFLTEPQEQGNALARLQRQFGGRHKQFDRAIADLHAAQSHLAGYFPEQELMLDFTGVGQYGYHSGLIFACYVPGLYSAVARGGRYDGIGEVYGRPRPAVGFSLDLLDLASVCALQTAEKSLQTSAMPTDAERFAAISGRRRQGEIIRFQHHAEE